MHSTQTLTVSLLLPATLCGTGIEVEEDEEEGEAVTDTPRTPEGTGIRVPAARGGATVPVAIVIHRKSG